MYTSKNFRPIAITLAGFDPSGGAGVLADVKTFESLKVYGLAVNTSITIQNDQHFSNVLWQKPTVIKSTLEILAERYEVKAAKLGLHKDLKTVYENISALKKIWPSAKIVWDPILASSSGYDFKIDLNRKILNKILSSVDLITPNSIEFGKFGMTVDDYSCHLLLKGGHVKGKHSEDCLFVNGKLLQKYVSSRENKSEKHGSGCVLSSAITAGLAKGYSLPRSVSKAKKYIDKFLSSTKTLSGFHKI